MMERLTSLRIKMLCWEKSYGFCGPAIAYRLPTECVTHPVQSQPAAAAKSHGLTACPER